MPQNLLENYNAETDLRYHRLRRKRLMDKKLQQKLILLGILPDNRGYYRL